ncbi:hypothetical protein F5146DRAFT_1059987 [Armillaria mellea]|nr:hypothetical protein F5146DRAFT_1059987 [Armillaria mellea]
MSLYSTSATSGLWLASVVPFLALNSFRPRQKMSQNPPIPGHFLISCLLRPVTVSAVYPCHWQCGLPIASIPIFYCSRVQCFRIQVSIGAKCVV